MDAIRGAGRLLEGRRGVSYGRFDRRAHSSPPEIRPQCHKVKKLADHRMAPLEKAAAKLAVTGNACTWYAKYKSTWKVIIHTESEGCR